MSIASTTKSLAKSSLQLRTEDSQGRQAPALSPLDEAQAIRCIQTSLTTTPPGTPAINRMDFAFAFDPIAAADTLLAQPASYLEPSVFDRNLEPIVLDVAPYVRGIVAYDVHLQKQRLKLSSLVSEGGRKRMRTTRSAFSALQGGSRSMTRGERWFKADINPYLVAKTAGEGWNGRAAEEEEEEEEATPEKAPKTSSSPGSSPQSSPDSTPTKTAKACSARGRKRQKVLHSDEADELG